MIDPLEVLTPLPTGVSWSLEPHEAALRLSSLHEELRGDEVVNPT